TVDVMNSRHRRGGKAQVRCARRRFLQVTAEPTDFGRGHKSSNMPDRSNLTSTSLSNFGTVWSTSVHFCLCWLWADHLKWRVGLQHMTGRVGTHLNYPTLTL
ncbi:hypothetical protein COCVIDRAFT_100653, partial [Bipolaris victoriae FI3]